MGIVLKLIGGLLLIGLGLVLFKDYFVITVAVIILLVVLYWLIRFSADLFWKGKDNDWW